MAKGDVKLMLGCFGRTDDGFISCPAAENCILTVTQSQSNYSELMDFFDSFKLFDRRILDYNAVRHMLFNIRERFDQLTSRIWSEKEFLLYQKFTIAHRDCGIYLGLNTGE